MRKWTTWVAVQILVAMLATTIVTAQIEVKTETAKALTGLIEPSVVGNLILFKDGSPKQKNVAILYVEAVGDVSVDGSDASRMPVEIKSVSPGVYLVDTPGKTWVEVSEYGEVELAGGQRRKILLDRKTVVVEVNGPGPEPVPPGPPPGPGPTPPPGPGPFEGLAGKVSKLAATMPVANKIKLQSVFEEAALKLGSGEFLQVSQAGQWITTNRPQCTPGAGCAELYNFLAADARGRVMSINAVQDYYREIAKGLRQ